MAAARVITLVPVENQAVTFEEAFGEYSEARGRGRERRKKRREERKEAKLERIAGRKEVKQARIAARDEVKGDRQERRILRRERRKAGRQAIRGQQMGARQARRTERQAIRAERRGARTEARLGRRGMRRDFRDQRDMEQGLDVETPEVTNGVGFEEQGYSEPETTQTYGDETQGTYDQSGNYGDQGYGEPSYGGGQGGYDYGDEEGAPYTEEDYYQPETGGEGGYYEGDEGVYSDDTFGPEYGEGVYNEEGDYVGEESGYLADYDTGENFDGKPIDVDPQIQDAVDKLAWNAECVRRLEQKRKLMPNKAQAISKKMLEHKKRFNELKSSLDDYSNADGGDMPRRKMMVKRAWMISKGKIKNAGRKKPMLIRPADDVIPVAADLKPSFSPNRIVVPNQQKSYATGTGLTGLDLQDDFDAPDVREIYLGADGSKSGIVWSSVVLGVGLGVAAVWAINKYKLLK
jgi:hypothetical protein